MLTELLAFVPFFARLGGDPPIEPPPEPRPAPAPEPKPEEVREPEKEDEEHEPESDVARLAAFRLQMLTSLARTNADLREQLIDERRLRAQLEGGLGLRAADFLQLPPPIRYVGPSDVQRELLGAFPQYGFCTCVPARADMLLERYPIDPRSA